uniref:Coluporin-13 n=1 Tax=Colubraria reticulata TaxID=604273 RepID=A0A499RKE0_9CAEN|nr:coluporin-13 [Colubraria reticulata]
MVLQFPSLKTAVLIFYFVIGHGPPPVVTDNNKTDETNVYIAADQAVKNKWSAVTIPRLEKWNRDWWVYVAIQVENWTRHPLTYPRMTFQYGWPVWDADTIQPGERATFLARKAKNAGTGTSGTLSWMVGSTNRLFELMWSNPFSSTLSSNWLGLGMTKTGTVDRVDRFTQMYSGDSDDKLAFVRNEFYTNIVPIHYRDDQFQILGWMTKSTWAYVEVYFYPAEGNYDDLAESIVKNLKDNWYYKTT